jgi:hypothetical protein
MKTQLLFLILACTLQLAARTPVSIEKAIKSGYITFEAKGKGGYSGSCLQMKITNKHKDSLYVVLEAGRRLNSLNDEEQDILVTKEQLVKLRGGETKTTDVFGFCCQAGNHSPAKDSKFGVGRMSDSSLTALAKFCNENKFSTDDIQSSVWCLSDNHSIASIPGNNDKLRKFVGSIKHEEIPWYQKDYVAGTGRQSFSDQANKITGTISYTTLADGYMNIQLRDANGHLVQKFTNNKLIEKGNYDYWFELQVTNWPKGKYFIYIYSGEQLLTKKDFVI